MKTPLSLSISLILAACSTNAEQRGTTSDALTAPGGDQCAEVTFAALDELYDVVQAGRDSAQQDVDANGAAGANASAAVAARDSFAEAIRKLDEHYVWLAVEGADDDPLAINFVEAAVTGRVAWGLSDDLQQAVHWSSVSAIFHQSALARAAMEDAFLAIELANAIEVRGLRCYVDNHQQ